MKSANNIERCWVAAWPNTSGRPSDLVSLCMRFDDQAWAECCVREPVHLEKCRLLKTPGDDKTMEVHLRLGLLTTDSLVKLRDAIDNYLNEHERHQTKTPKADKRIHRSV